MTTDTATDPQAAQAPVKGIRTVWLRPVRRYDPVYLRIAKELCAKIESGEIGPGEAMPSITALRKEHHCSRRSAGHAFQLLESDNLVERAPGLGYFRRQ